MYEIREYQAEDEQAWDDFVNAQSMNGTFLQSRNFLNYHPQGRFEDCSLMIYDAKGHLCAVIPACTYLDGKKKVFFSHKGSTFGGIVCLSKLNRVEKLFPLLDELFAYWKEKGYDEIYLKPTSDVFSMEYADLLPYALQYYGFTEYKELNTYIDFQRYHSEIKRELSKMKRRCVNSCEKAGFRVVPLREREEIAAFYDILTKNLEKYETKPVHTLEELLDFHESRLKSECGFWGCFDGDRMIAGAMMFYFQRSSAAHTQYLAALPEYSKLSPMTFVYYSMIKEMREMGYQKISFGIATEDFGRYLNTGLISSKESFGARHSNNLIYYLDNTIKRGGGR